MTGQKKTKCKSKKKSKKTTPPKVIGLYGVKITKGMHEQKEHDREVREFVSSLPPSNVSGADQRKANREWNRFKSGHGDLKWW